MTLKFIPSLRFIFLKKAAGLSNQDPCPLSYYVNNYDIEAHHISIP